MLLIKNNDVIRICQARIKVSYLNSWECIYYIYTVKKVGTTETTKLWVIW